MNTTASSTQVLIFLHQIHQQCDSTWIEIDISVQSEQIGVLRHYVLAINRDRQFHQPVSEQVVHVHDLRPTLTMSNTILVLEMGNQFCLSRQGPNQTTSVRRWILLRWPQPDVGLMYLRGCFVNRIDQDFDEPIALNIIIAVIGNFESVIEENVRWNQIRRNIYNNFEL